MKRQKLRSFLLLLSFLLFPITLFYFSPYLIIQAGFLGIVSGSFCFFLGLFLMSLFSGRAFCGWLCPAGGLQECCFSVTDKRIKNKKVSYIKYFIWVIWIFGIIASFMYAGKFHGVDFFYMTDHGISAAGIPGLITYFAIVALITILALTVGKRGMCHTICWMAPFMILGTKLKDKLNLPSLHLKATTTICVNCQICTRNCPMSLDVHTMVQNNNMKKTECILCGKCADTCSKNAIRLTFKK